VGVELNFNIYIRTPEMSVLTALDALLVKLMVLPSPHLETPLLQVAIVPTHLALIDCCGFTLVSFVASLAALEAHLLIALERDMVIFAAKVA
jgi:hypothetical protein